MSPHKIVCLVLLGLSHYSLNVLLLGEGCEVVRQRTFAELYTDVATLAAAMRAIGIRPGDRVVGWLCSIDNWLTSDYSIVANTDVWQN